MGESLLLITIITLVVLTIRRARPVVLENPVIIQRPGQYHITLAPQLNRAQIFIEQIAGQFSKTHSPQGDISSQYFEVRDPKVFARGESCYLLAATLRDGLLYFQAINPLASHPDAGITNDLAGVVGQPGQMAITNDLPSVFCWNSQMASSSISSSISHLATIREFSEAVLKLHPHKEPADEQGAEKLGAAVEAVANQLQIAVKAL
jgi:hypothetical protein